MLMMLMEMFLWMLSLRLLQLLLLLRRPLALLCSLLSALSWRFGLVVLQFVASLSLVFSSNSLYSAPESPRNPQTDPPYLLGLAGWLAGHQTFCLPFAYFVLSRLFLASIWVY